MTLGDWLGGRTGYGAWPFPRHRVRLAWLVALFGVPPGTLFFVPLDTVAYVLILVAWLGAATGISVMALLDWSCKLSSGRSRIARGVQTGARALISGLGTIGVVAGAWMVCNVVIALFWRDMRAPQALLYGGLALSVCATSAVLTVLPYARMRLAIDEQGTDGA